MSISSDEPLCYRIVRDSHDTEFPRPLLCDHHSIPNVYQI